MTIKNIKFKYSTTLLIDDNYMDNFINKKMLESTQFSENIHISTNGELALNLVKDLITPAETKMAIYPDVMFVDLNMPVMNGFEFIENFKKINDKKLMECKIIILTSSIDEEDKLKAERIDSQIVFVNKPLTNDLLNCL